VADAGAEGFGSGLLGSKTGGQTLGGVALAEAVCLFGGSVHAVEESGAETLYRLLDSGNFDQVNAAANDHVVYQANTSARGRACREWGQLYRNGSGFACIHCLRGTADNVDVNQASTSRGNLQHGTIPWALQMRAISSEEPGRLIKTVTGAILGCGGWVLSRSATDTGLLDILFEFERNACVDIYAILIASGLELSRAAHLQFTELCQCTKFSRRDCSEEIVSVDLEIQTFGAAGLEDAAPAAQ
jgi:hypothetical protein